MDAVLVRLRGWIEASHPFPLAAVLALTALIGIASATDEGVDAGRLALVVLAMLCSQLAIGWTNDFVDRETDRRHQPSKPIASGRVDARYMPLASLAALAGVLVIGIVLGPLPLLFLAIGTAAGLAYDLWLKQTHWSWAPFIVAFAVLLPYVWSSLGLFREELAAIYVIGLALVPAVHIANVLPDIEADAAAGRRNLALIWGRRSAIRIIAVCLVTPLLLTLLSLAAIEYNATLLGVMVLVYAGVLAATAMLYLRGLDRMAFQGVVIASVLFAGGWLAAV
ncbi:MAG: UbiA family prenyltransferase [Dehalococcoidia bacterium]